MKIRDNDIILRERAFYPTSLFEHPSAVHDDFVHHMYDDKICKHCPYKRHRYCDECETCELGGYKGSYTTAKFVTKGGVDYLALPLGAKFKFKNYPRIAKKGKVHDMRTAVAMSKKHKFTRWSDLREDQVKAIDEMARQGYGILKSPPRTGKTVMGIALALKLGLRCAIIADQKDFLDGFYETITEWTDLPKSAYGFASKPDDYKKFDIALITYQQLIRDGVGDEKIKLINDNYGIVMVDEVQAGNADEYTRVISRLRQKHRYGLTATEKRKDKKHVLMFDFIGPVMYENETTVLVPKLYAYPTKTKCRPYKGMAAWTRTCSAIAKDDKRNRAIAEKVLVDLKKGRSIVMGVYYKHHIKSLVKMINDLAEKDVAIGFEGGPKAKKLRKQIVDDARASKIRVVVGIRKLMQRGINVPRWDTLYYIMPMSNEHNWEQESSRILTPDTTGLKQSPLIRMYFEPEIGLSVGCFRATVGHSKALGHTLTDHMKQVLSDHGITVKGADKTFDLEPRRSSPPSLRSL